MRKYAYLKEPIRYDEKESIVKIMLYEDKEGFYLFEYPSMDAVQCSHDLCYDSLEDLYEDWNDLIDERGWIGMDDPLPGCQHDAFIPLRVKGRDTGNPEWGRYETLKDGKWIEYRSPSVKVILETERLFLREMNMDDYEALYKVLADPVIMQYYPYAFDEQRVRGWITRNMDRYREDGFGLWAVCLKDTGEMIGDCGLTLQQIDGETLPEIGYHIRGDHQYKGYAKEAAGAVRDWAFQHLSYPALYSYCKAGNIASIRTAEAIGMRSLKEYPDEANGITHVSVIEKQP